LSRVLLQGFGERLYIVVRGTSSPPLSHSISSGDEFIDEPMERLRIDERHERVGARLFPRTRGVVAPVAKVQPQQLVLLRALLEIERFYHIEQSFVAVCDRQTQTS